MKMTCPKCSSEDIKEIEMARFTPEGESVKYMGETESMRYECKKCGWNWKKK
ncbi:MAG: hypothetical protein V1908_04065 [Candidatus Peregrinibacteria bacterium]